MTQYGSLALGQTSLQFVSLFVALLSFAAVVLGIVSASVLMAVVALANVYTNDMLLWQCLATKTLDYERLSGAIFGPVYKV